MFCLKVTSKTVSYEDNDGWLGGCVYYKTGDVDCFKRNTVIQIDNQFGIPYHAITRARTEGKFKLLGQLPNDFHQKLIEAAHRSLTLSQIKRERLLQVIGEE